jgi:hypothetical protein
MRFIKNMSHLILKSIDDLLTQIIRHQCSIRSCTKHLIYILLTIALSRFVQCLFLDFSYG